MHLAPYGLSWEFSDTIDVRPKNEFRKSAKQSTIAMPSIEAEYIVAAEASMEAVWMRKFIDGLGDVMPSNKRPIEMLCDNESSIMMANDSGIMKGARHFQRKYTTFVKLSAKQNTIVMSSIEAEYIVAAKASMEAVWMRKFIDGLGDVMPSNKIPMEMLCDNESSIMMANDPRIIKGARHFQKKYYYIRKVIQDGEIVLKKVHTYDNIVDLFTKPMSYNKHYEHAMVIGIYPDSSLM
uniref:Retrotransposon protein, putative, Ty1-copia subclass n=1 Tax=Tanacetum cinerariifolium TaxID=118510 RepID=A0A699H934_TANCI|nr:hypothetical protein [Tanacetum cinerariifolium]